MANYSCAIRTNYFHVKDEEAFRKLMERSYGSEDEIKVWEKTAPNGDKLFGFGCYSGIAGVLNSADEEDDDCESSYDEFIDGLQTCVADDDAIIILESGNEKLRYLVGQATIITTDKVVGFEMNNWAQEAAARLLNNPNYRTVCTS